MEEDMETTNEHISESLADTERIAKELLSNLTQGENTATVVGLIGDLGSGKTTFVKSLAKALGVTERVMSPTFILERIYEIPEDKQFSRLVHVDLYRIEEERELLALGLQETISDSKNLVVIEWADKVRGVLPEDAKKVYFEYVDEEKRKITWQK